MSGIILGMGSANERKRFIVTPPLIGWAHTQNDAWHVDGSVQDCSTSTANVLATTTYCTTFYNYVYPLPGSCWRISSALMAAVAIMAGWEAEKQ